MRAMAIFVIVLAVRDVAACSAIAWDPNRIVSNDVVSNDVVSSSNGRYKAVVRRLAIPDFQTTVAAAVSYDPSRTHTTVALYGPQLIAEIDVPMQRIETVLVPNSGKYVVALVTLGRGCGGWATTEDAFVTLYTAQGAQVGAFKVGDIFNSWDLWWIRDHQVEYELREDVFVVKIAKTDSERVERRIDIATATLIDPKTDIFPRPRATVTPLDLESRPTLAAPSDCAAAFDDPALVRIPSSELYARAEFGPVPKFPEPMMKARVRGPVIVDMVVSEFGEVLCTRASALPFGGSDAASSAARRWIFTPMNVDGHRVKFAGKLLFRFDDIDDETWRERMRNAPPYE